MKSKRQIPAAALFLFSFILMVAASTQPSESSGQTIDPATGLPATGNAPRINPATGLPDNGPALHLNPVAPAPAAGLPFLPPPRDPFEDGPFDLPAPGQKPDFNKILLQANVLTRKGRYDEALQHLVWYYTRSEMDPSQKGVRVSFALSYWDDLSGHYPNARPALVEIRDDYAQRLLDGHGSSALFQDVVAINQHLGNEEDTYTLFKSIEQRDPKLAGQCYFYVESQLVQKGEYETCRKFIGDPQADFRKICQRYDRGLFSVRHFIEMRKELPHPVILQIPQVPVTPDPSVSLKKSVEDRFVNEVGDLIEILVATGSQSDAENIQKQAIIVLDDPRLETAVADAKTKFARTP